MMKALLFLLVLTIIEAYLHTKSPQARGKVTGIHMAGGQPPMVPYFPRIGSKDYQWMDIYNALGRQRTLFVGRFLDDEACNSLIASLIYLQGWAFSLLMRQTDITSTCNTCSERANQNL